MNVQLNHTIVWCRDKTKSAGFLAEMLGRPAPRTFFHFLVVDLDNEVSLDFYEHDEALTVAHYAFLVSDAEFDAILGRIQTKQLAHWADPGKSKPGETNTFGGGRGVYFEDPNGHLLEAITRPYPVSL